MSNGPAQWGFIHQSLLSKYIIMRSMREKNKWFCYLLVDSSCNLLTLQWRSHTKLLQKQLQLQLESFLSRKAPEKKRCQIYPAFEGVQQWSDCAHPKFHDGGRGLDVDHHNPNLVWTDRLQTARPRGRTISKKRTACFTVLRNNSQQVKNQ